MFRSRMKARAESKADHMNSERPADLPDFGAPPLTEAVMGAQFDVIPGFLTPHIGLLWQHFRASFPLLEEQAPLAPVFETFGLICPRNGYSAAYRGRDSTRVLYQQGANRAPPGAKGSLPTQLEEDRIWGQLSPIREDAGDLQGRLRYVYERNYD